MKYILYTILLLLVGACTSDRNPQTEAVVFNSPLVFKMDYANLDLNKTQQFSDFERLFAATNSIRLDNIEVLNQGQTVYDFNQNLGDIVITKEKNNQYLILEHYIIPIGSVYGKFALLKYRLDPKKGTIERDQEFKPQLAIYKYWSNHVVKEYDSYLSDTSFTTQYIEKVPFRAFETMRFLMFNLTLATVLEDCQDCEDRMKRITKDYSFVESKEYFEQNLFVCNTILSKTRD